MTSQGLEVEYQFAPNDRWTLSGGATYLDSTYDDFEPSPGNDLTGEPTQMAPDLALSGNIVYEHPIGNGTWSLRNRAGYLFRTEYFTDLENTEISKNDATFTLDLSATLIHHDSGVSLQAWGRNVTDEDIILASAFAPFSDSDEALYISPDDQATWGVTAAFRF